MVFWKKKSKSTGEGSNERADRIFHRDDDAAIEPPVEYDAEIDPDLKHSFEQSEMEVLDDLDEIPVPAHTPADDLHEQEDLSDHTNEGGWFSRLTQGLSKSSSKLTSGISDLLLKSKLDAGSLDDLEEILIEADLGPKTAAKVIGEFSQKRFGDDAGEREIRTALAETMAEILDPVAKPLKIEKPANGPFVILVCGVNGVGKTTTIGKFAQRLKNEGYKIMVAAGDTFRAAAVEQLKEWASRTNSGFYSKDVGADAASVAFESYEKAKKENIDVLLIDTAGRLHNKQNLMAELEKIVRVLKKQDENLPHATLLVLDATTGQNAFAQLETFKSMVNVTGLIVTKLDGSARGGVLVGLADQFGVPVHAIGIGEQAGDMQPFSARDYARSLMGLPA
ncbi:MAG: signal recognition particle-docking protein FtsY [Micavibrio sp.]|nr:signal recognition particle-docking protein FtsY [Micavibrio sp.]